MNSKEFYSNGKLLLTGEYLVMEGARALAVPVKYGQSLHVEDNHKKPGIDWESRMNGKLWFNANFEFPFFEAVETSSKYISDNLSEILQEAFLLNESKINPGNSLKVKTELTFDRNWGLGSSSTLISNIAYWFDIDPYDLFWLVYDGSAYDIACARAYKPIIYSVLEQKPEIERAAFDPSFKNNIYFVYTGKKAITAKGIEHFRQKKNFNTNDIQSISDLTKEMSATKNLSDFEKMMSEHESIISGILKTERVKDKYFNDFEGEIKSLGAWGGDFVMVTWRGKREKLKEYFKSKGLEVVFRFDEMVL